MNDAVRRFSEGIAALKGADPAILAGPGTTAVPDASRAGTRQVVCYQIAGHAVVPCDPAVLDVAKGLDNDDVSMTDDDFRRWAAGAHCEVLGQAVMKVVGVEGLRDVEPAGVVRVFDWSKPEDLELMQAFVDTCDADDLEAAEVDMDDLDELAVGLIDDGGAIRAYASSQPFEDELPFGDIGIVTASSQRNGGWGRSAVSALVREVLMPAGIDPVYRCDPENLGSHRLSDALGFETVAALTVVRLPDV